MIRFGTIRRSRSVTVTATSTAQPSELTSASTETPNVAMHATTRAAKTTTAMGRSLATWLRSGCRARSCLLQRPSIGDAGLRTRWRRRRRRSRRPPTAAGARSSPKSSTTAKRRRPTPCTEVLSTGIPQRRGEQADDRRADAGHGGLDCGALPRRRPERQRRAEKQERRQEDRDERDRGARDPVRRRMLDRTEVGGEREERPGHGLGGAVAGEERLLRDPARSDDGLVEERQDDVAAAEDERSRPVEAWKRSSACQEPRAAPASGRPTSKHDEAVARTRSP